jgi:hypothetical protein
MASPPRPPPTSADLWQSLDFLVAVGVWLESLGLNLLNGQASIKAIIMTQADRLISADAAESQQLADLTTQIHSEMQDLATAFANAPGQTDPKVEAVISSLVARTATLAELTQGLLVDGPVSAPTDVGGSRGPTPQGTPAQTRKPGSTV